MGKRRRQVRRSDNSSPGHTSGGGLESLLALVLWALFFARWLVPTEGSPEGETLWLTALVLPVSAFWFWWQSKQQHPRLSIGWMDLCVWSLAGAHILAALLVVAGEGEKRLALNMLWEWFSLAVLLSTLRQTLLTETARDRFLRAFVVLGVALAVFGLWQHYFWYESNIREYETLRAELELLDANPSPTLDQLERRADLVAQFQSDNIPLLEPRRGLFERRLRDSTEPLGFFALANSFAGILSLITVLLAAGLLESLVATAQSSDDSGEVAAPETAAGLRKWLIRYGAQIGCLALVGFTLLLTKSRTAFVGTTAGVMIAGFLSAAGLRREAKKRILTAVALGLVMVGALVGGAFATGSLDVEVLSEATKSLNYRMQYWRGTAKVIADSPWFGVGPGNFRPHYMHHKLPEASEEISDPHNLILDVVASSGIPGGLALLLLAAVLLRNSCGVVQLRGRTATDGTEGSSPKAEAAVPSMTWMMATAFGLVLGWQFLAEASFNVRLASVGILATGFSSVASRSPVTWHVPGAGLSRGACLAAVSALVVHLLAAGGIAMPAICGCLLVLAVLIESGSGADASGKSAVPRVMVLVLAIALVTAFAACLKTAFLPVIQSTAALRSGDFEGTRHARLDRAQRHFADAAEADPFSPEPLMRLSDVAFLFWEQQPGASEQFAEGVKFALEAEKRNPHNGLYAYQIGRRHRQLFLRTGDAAAAESAVEWLEKALEKYPTHPLWNAEYTLALKEAGQNDDARLAAKRTIQLDKVNRDAGHIDRYLPEDMLDSVRALVVTPNG